MTPTSTDPFAEANTGAMPYDAGEKSSEGLKSQVSKATSHVKNTAAEFGRSAAENIDRNLAGAAGALERTASTLRQRAGSGSGKVSEVAMTAADKLEGTAKYFRDHHTEDMVRDVEQVVRRKPGVSIAVALGVGFLIGMSMKKDRY